MRPAFEAAVDEVADSARRLMASLTTDQPPRDRAVEADAGARAGAAAVRVKGDARVPARALSPCAAWPDAPRLRGCWLLPPITSDEEPTISGSRPATTRWSLLS